MTTIATNTEATVDPSKVSTTDDATTTATNTKPSSTTTNKINYVFVLCSFSIVLLWCISQYILIPYVLHLLLLVTCILYVSCHISLLLLNDDEPIIIKDENGNDIILPINSERETLQTNDAYYFPIIGSISLFTLYCAFTYFDKDFINLLIGGYFGIIGTFAIIMTFIPFFISITPNKLHVLIDEIKWEHTIYHPFQSIKFLLGNPKSPFTFTIIFCIMEIIASIISFGIIVYYYYYNKPWYINNILGICFCIQGIQRFSLGTYKIGCILLIGLFFYDIFWVFGTNVMVTVAKNLDGPIKILLPRTLEKDPISGNYKDLSLLGLGDIVIPGFFLALLLRFDAHQYISKKINTNTDTFIMNIHESFPKPYFHAGIISYVAGLGFTIFIMMYFNAAQPALLYLVPACLGSSLLTAFIRNELKDLFAYSEEIVESENDNDIVEVVNETESKKEQ